MKSIANKDKNIFLNILTLIMLFVLFSAVGLFFLVRSSRLYLYLTILSFLVFILAAMTIYLLLILVLIVRITKKNNIPRLFVPIFENSIKLIYPIMVAFSDLLKIEKDPIRRFFSEINNKIVIQKSEKLKPEDILLIAPHCLQKSSCKYKITGSIENCKRCGACDINDLIELCISYSINLQIVTGGTLARKVITDYKPKGIIAVACERDLSHGILDVKNIPVIGIRNERPYGPCYNTCVEIDKVENAIKLFLRRN